MKTTLLTIKWGTSRARDSYGYTLCSLYIDGEKAERCNGGGYDMTGTVIGNYIARVYTDRLRALKPSDMPKQSHWERADPIPNVCRSVNCLVHERGLFTTTNESITHCPRCQSELSPDYIAGKRVDDGRYFYGLKFINPKFDPGKVKLHVPPTFGTEKDIGKTIEQCEREKTSLGLDRYQAFWQATNNYATKLHTVPNIDGAVGLRQVEEIGKAIGLTLQSLPSVQKNLTLFALHDERNQ